MRRLNHAFICAGTAAGLALAVATATPAVAASEWDLDFTADATGTVQSFGVPNTATYGQLITVPDGPIELAAFSFDVNLPATVVFRGVVQEWDTGTGMATGPELYQSEARSTAGAGVETVTFTPDIPITAGTYVIFMTVSYDYAGGSGTGQWSASEADVYPDGHFVFMNDSGDINLLTTVPWSVYSWMDLGFVVEFNGAPVTPPATPVIVAPAYTG
jgi:hypothetical protein